MRSTTPREYLDALLARDSHRARAAIDRALDQGTPAEDVALEVLIPALHEIGDLWERGVLSVAHEHYATGITEGVMAMVAARMRTPPAGGRLAIVACPSGERHALAARMVGDFLEGAGWEAIVCGPDVPSRDVVSMVADEQPDLVAVSVTMRDALGAASELLGAVGVVEPTPMRVIGGQAVVDARETGADAHAETIQQLMRLVDERLPPLPEDD